MPKYRAAMTCSVGIYGKDYHLVEGRTYDLPHAGLAGIVRPLGVLTDVEDEPKAAPEPEPEAPEPEPEPDEDAEGKARKGYEDKERCSDEPVRREDFLSARNVPVRGRGR